MEADVAVRPHPFADLLAKALTVIPNPHVMEALTAVDAGMTDTGAAVLVVRSSGWVVRVGWTRTSPAGGDTDGHVTPVVEPCDWRAPERTGTAGIDLARVTAGVAKVCEGLPVESVTATGRAIRVECVDGSTLYGTVGWLGEDVVPLLPVSRPCRFCRGPVFGGEDGHPCCVRWEAMGSGQPCPTCRSRGGQ